MGLTQAPGDVLPYLSVKVTAGPFWLTCTAAPIILVKSVGLFSFVQVWPAKVPDENVMLLLP